MEIFLDLTRNYSSIVIGEGGDTVVSLGEVSNPPKGRSGLLVGISNSWQDVFGPGSFGVANITCEEDPAGSVVDQDGQ